MNKINVDLIRLIEVCNLDYLNVKSSELVKLGEEKLKIKRNPLRYYLGFLYEKIRYRKYIGNSGYEPKHHENCWDNLIWEKALIRQDNSKIVVYSCITGNYDKVVEPKYNLNENIKYILYTDNKIQSKVWEIRSIPNNLKNYSSTEINRYIKMHPNEYFNDFDYSIYIDGNVTVMSDLSGLTNLINDKYGFAMHTHVDRDCICDEVMVCGLLKKGNYDSLREQIRDYESEKFPRNYGLLECTVIACDLRKKIAEDIFDQWWKEYLKSKSHRDQISLPYVLWKNNILISDVGTLGDNVYKNPKLRIKAH